jgi:hypothetical protein
VLGFSASPVNGSTEGKVLDALSSLLWTLGARPHLIAEDDEHVQQVGGSTTCHSRWMTGFSQWLSIINDCVAGR